MAAGQFELERLVGTRLTKQGNRIILEAAGVVKHLLLETCEAVCRGHPFDNVLDDALLCLGKRADLGLRDLPVGIDRGATFIVQRQRHLILLFG